MLLHAWVLVRCAQHRDKAILSHVLQIQCTALQRLVSCVYLFTSFGRDCWLHNWSALVGRSEEFVLNETSDQVHPSTLAT